MRLLTIKSSLELSESQRLKLERGIQSKEKDVVSFCYVHDSSIGGIQVYDGDRLLDVSSFHELDKIKHNIQSYLSTLNDGLSIYDIPDLLKREVGNLKEKNNFVEFGKVTAYFDGIIQVSGLNHCKYKEIILIGNKGYALVMNLQKDYILAIVLDCDEEITYDDLVFATHRVIEIPVGYDFIGRVIDPLGNPLDDKGKIKATGSRRIEENAPRIIDRSKVNTPLYTGLLALDAMIPIGKGQRELIIGDRQTGKTSIIADTIINQKGKNVFCIYVAIGQRASAVNELIHNLEKHQALDYTCIVVSTASDNSAMQYIAPYSGTALADFLMYQGKDVLIAYDDLSKHAVAYRTISLLLKRPAGREAFPGDIFYIHSKLLERSAKLSAASGGGSMTALPVIETQAGDISAYIPTNVISITDGQIYLQKDLFNAGQRPAINVGLSVSRIGGSAQSKLMRKWSAKLRLDIAHYRELANFSQFGASLDSLTRQILANGKKIEASICQPNFAPFSLGRELIYLYAINHQFLQDIPLNQTVPFLEQLFDFISLSAPKIINDLENDVFSEELDDLCRDFTAMKVKQNG